MKSPTVQRLMCQALLLACLDVCLGNPAWKGYVPWAWFWFGANVVVGAIYVAAEIGERRA